MRLGWPCGAAVARRFDLDPHEVVLLGEAARTADLCADLAARVDQDGLTLPWGEGQVRAHPLLARLESSRALLARLIAGLQIAGGGRRGRGRSSGGGGRIAASTFGGRHESTGAGSVRRVRRSDW